MFDTWSSSRLGFDLTRADPDRAFLIPALPQAFHAVDRGFFDSLDDKLAERAKLLMSLPEGNALPLLGHIKMPALYFCISGVYEISFSSSLSFLSLHKALSDLHLRGGSASDEAFEKYPELVTRVETLDAEIRGGTSAVVALVFNNRLYVANAGNSRALLCRTDPEEEGGTLRVFQLSVDHNLTNEDECKRCEDEIIDSGCPLSNSKDDSNDN